MSVCNKIHIRRYRPSDLPLIEKLFYDTVHTVNAKDYTQEQLDAWADGKISEQAWDDSFQKHYTIVAEKNGDIIGFGDIDTENAYLDRLYVHKDHQRQGIASSICDELENNCTLRPIKVHASITAKAFFEKRGYRTLKKQEVERKGIKLTNYVIELI